MAPIFDRNVGPFEVATLLKLCSFLEHVNMLKAQLPTNRCAIMFLLTLFLDMDRHCSTFAASRRL
jgi:hypothetical protein